MTKPTIFGRMGNKFLGGGEAGAEAVLPIRNLVSYVEDGVYNSMQKLMMDLKQEEIDYDKLAYACSKIHVVNKIGEREFARAVMEVL